MKNRRVLVVSASIAVAAALFVSGYVYSAPKVPKEIRVGCVASVTGMFAGMADGGVFGLQAAFEDINRQGGIMVKEYGQRIPVKLTVVDSESDPAKTGLLAESLVVQEKVQFLVCHNEPPPVHAPVARVAAKHKIPHLADVAVMEPWLGMRADASPPFDYTWALGFAIATPGPPGYTILDSWKEELESTATRRTRRWGYSRPTSRMERPGTDFSAGAERVGVQCCRGRQEVRSLSDRHHRLQHHSTAVEGKRRRDSVGQLPGA